MAGLPRNPATNRLAGFSYNAIGVSICWISPSFNTTIRWPSVIAST